MIAQKDAAASLETGLGIDKQGYNIFIAGDSTSGIKRVLRHLLEQKKTNTKSPLDWIYVYNFDSPKHPLALSLKPGKGKDLKRRIQLSSVIKVPP